jgi:hypothetical protein
MPLMALLRRRADFPLRAWDQSLISSTQLLGPPVGLTLPSNSYTRGPPSPFLKKQMRRARNNPKWGKLTIRLARHICRPQMMKLQKCRCNIAALTYNIYMKSSCGRPSRFLYQLQIDLYLWLAQIVSLQIICYSRHQP